MKSNRLESFDSSDPLEPSKPLQPVMPSTSLELVLCHELKHTKIMRHPKTNILEVSWEGVQTIETIKAGGEAILECLKQNRCTRVLNDNTNKKGGWAESVEWASTVWLDEMKKAGLEHFAWVIPDSQGKFPFKKLTVDIVSFDSKVVSFFETYQEAHDWIYGTLLKISE